MTSHIPGCFEGYPGRVTHKKDFPACPEIMRKVLDDQAAQIAAITKRLAALEALPNNKKA